MSRESKLVKNTIVLSIGTFLPKLASFVTIPILTGFLTKEEYGTYDLILVLVSLLLPAASLQIQTAAFRFLIDERDNEKSIKKIVTNIFVFIIPSSVTALLIVFWFLPGDIIIRLLVCLYLLLDMLVNAARQVARGLNKNMAFSVNSIINSFGIMIFAVVFVWALNWGLLGAVLSLVLSTAIALIDILFRSLLYKYIDLKTIAWKEIKKMIAYSWPMVPNSMSMWVMQVSDRFVISTFMGLAANAVYSVANKIPSLLSIAQSTFTMAWQENASIVSKDEDADAYYESMFHTMFDLMAGALGLLICATPLLFVLLIRGDYSESYHQMPILFIGMFFSSMCSYLGGIYVAYKDTKSVGITTTAAAVCNLVVDLALIHFIGIYAASISTLVSFLLLFVFRMINVRKLVKIKYHIRHILIVFGILVVESALCFFQMPVLDLINILLGIVVFFILNRSLIKVVYTKIKQKLRKKQDGKNSNC